MKTTGLNSRNRVEYAEEDHGFNITWKDFDSWLESKNGYEVGAQSRSQSCAFAKYFREMMPELGQYSHVGTDYIEIDGHYDSNSEYVSSRMIPLKRWQKEFIKRFDATTQNIHHDYNQNDDTELRYGYRGVTGVHARKLLRQAVKA